MVSSEVQRTLVKSPPELWSELSDPESLARHLGELGEIKITRTEPENLVEWEAEGTTGTVEIAPSGWGTRVKLTVARELPAAADGEVVSDDQESAAPAAEELTPDRSAVPVDGDSQTDPASEAADDGAAAANEPPGSEPAQDDPAAHLEAVGVQDAHEPSETVLAHTSPETQIAERKPGPATEAARRAAGWPARGHASGPAIESDLRAAEALEGSPAEPQGMHEWATQAIEPDEGDPTGEHRPEEEPEHPRRGLFARLFGRRRGRAKAAPLDPAAFAPDDFDESAPENTSAAQEPEAWEEETGALEAAAAEAEPGREEPDWTTAPERLESELADPPPLAAQGAATGEPDAAAQERDAPAAEDETESEHAGPVALELDTAPADLGAVPQAEPEPVGRPETATKNDTTAQPVEPPAEAPQPATPVEKLAAELRAAEEVAEEQVEAVLTAVLDRLGSAHHRPFSRP